MSVDELIAAAAGAAERLGVLDAQGTLTEIAGSLSLAPRRLGWLLDLLAATGHVERSDGVYRPLRRGALAADGGKLVATVLRRDRPLEILELAGNVDAARLACHEGLTRVPAPLVARLADLVGDGLLLDAGCGDGALAAAVLEAQPAARALLVDRDVRHARRLEGPRVEVSAADARSLDRRARVVLVSNVLHTCPLADAEMLVRHAATLVEPGGTLVVREVALDDARGGPLFGLAFGLSLQLYTDAELPTETMLRSWTDAHRVERIAEAIVLEAHR